MQPLALVLPVALPVSAETPPTLAPAARNRFPEPLSSPVEGAKPRRQLDFSKALSQELELQVAPAELHGEIPQGELAKNVLTFTPNVTPLLAALRGLNPEALRVSEVEGNDVGLQQAPEPGLPERGPLNVRENVADVSPQPIWLPLPVETPNPYVPAEASAPVELPRLPQHVVGQVLQTVRGQQVVTQLDFQINPPALGPVNLQVSYTQGVVGVQLTALSLQAKHALESQLSTIQSTLLAHHLVPGTLKVILAAPGRLGSQGTGARHEGASSGFGGGHAARRRAGEAGDDPVRTV